MDEPKTVLVIDDNEAIIELLNEFLRREGYIVRGVGNGRAALEFLRNEHCDVVISDYAMPEMNGIELTRLIRPVFPHIFIIGISGYFDGDDFLKAGAQVFLAKPFKLQDLLSVFRSTRFNRHFELVQKNRENDTL
jgi:CheY-like chemotaxis protein